MEITADKITSMKYLPQVLEEALRLYTTVPYVNRRATATVSLKEEGMKYTIPAGTGILVQLYLLINRDSSVWNSLNKFDPE